MNMWLKSDIKLQGLSSLAFCNMGVSGPSLLIESTNPMKSIIASHDQLYPLLSIYFNLCRYRK